MRKLATAAAVSLALASSGAFGLGLGEIEMQSALNQPMDAEIRLTSVQPGELDGMIVQLASSEAFARAGIDRSSVLTDLRFSVDQSSGVPVIKIESNNPVTEPFLNFLLEVDWPQGRMVREYTVLLDPPVFLSSNASERNTIADQPALVDGGDAALVVPTPIERDADSDVQAGLSDLEDASSESVLSLEEATSDSILIDDGDPATIDEVTDDSLLSDRNALSGNISGNNGGVVSLSDQDAVNTDAAAQRSADALAEFALDDIQDGSGSDTGEISDDVVYGEDGQAIGTDLDDTGSLVSLDDLEEPAQRGSAGNAASRVTVGPGDTLFNIANDTAPSGISVQQMMMAMLAANEPSFINNNINLIRSGAILRVPDNDEANRLTQEQALAAISVQNQLWEDYRDALRSTAATQVAQNIAPQDSNVADAGAADSEATENNALSSQDPVETAAVDADETLERLTDEARTILENAREEVLSREELNIVADNSTASETASATADETTNADDARIGEINRDLQLAREELSSTRLRSDDLNSQASELNDTSEKLEAMVSLRQNEISRLETQLGQARENAEQNAVAEAEAAAEAEATAAAEAEAAEVEAQATAAADAAAEEEQTASTTAELTDRIEETVGSAANNAQDASAGVQAAVDGAQESVGNALTEAGESLEQAEPNSPQDGTVAAVETDVAAENTSSEPAETTQAWYQSFLDDPKRMAIAGVGALGLLGVLGTLLFSRKRRKREEVTLDDLDDAAFDTDLQAAPDISAPVRSNDSGAIAATGAGAAVAAAAAANAAAANNADEYDGVEAEAYPPLIDRADDTFDRFDRELENSYNEVSDGTQSVSGADNSGAHEVGDSSLDNELLDKDDTISEVDVYLAYGLHGQAEELLTKAMERQPDNQLFVIKLLQTYHAQGNNEAFHTAAKDYHERFGGAENPAWVDVAAMGADLKPGDPLYVVGQGAVTRVGNSDDNSTLSANDFLPANAADTAGSVSRDFGASESVADFEEETSLLDASLDPAFAFDENDLEATGDFSAISDELDELGAEHDELATDGSIDFPGAEESGTAANEARKDVGFTGADSANNDDLSLEDLDGLAESVDDLTLDLDQLTGDLELDSAELLNSDLSDLDIPDLTANNDLTLDSTGALGEGADEIDTMMDLAKAYIDMGDKDSASSTLGEIVKSGSPEQVTEAETLLRNIS